MITYCIAGIHFATMWVEGKGGFIGRGRTVAAAIEDMFNKSGLCLQKI